MKFHLNYLKSERQLERILGKRKIGKALRVLSINSKLRTKKRMKLHIGLNYVSIGVLSQPQTDLISELNSFIRIISKTIVIIKRGKLSN